MSEGHRLLHSEIDGRRTEPAEAFALEHVDAPAGVKVAALGGELDLAATACLRAWVEEAEGSVGAVLDLSGATFVDSSMLKELLRANSELARYGTRLVLAGVSPALRRLLDLTRTAELFAIADDRAQALAVLDR